MLKDKKKEGGKKRDMVILNSITHTALNFLLPLILFSLSQSARTSTFSAIKENDCFDVQRQT